MLEMIGTDCTGSNKTDRHDITEILWKVSLTHHNTKKLKIDIEPLFVGSIAKENGTDCTGSCKSNYHTITTTPAPLNFDK
jgi:hypothetical protein